MLYNISYRRANYVEPLRSANGLRGHSGIADTSTLQNLFLHNVFALEPLYKRLYLIL
jgi:hypothetical protein